MGDRSSLFGTLADQWPVRRALYVGSYVDLAPSTAIESVTYVDTDARAARFFADADAIRRSGRGIHYTRVAFAYLFHSSS